MKDWVKFGLGWGIWMSLLMAFVWPLIDGEEIILKKVIITGIYWIIAGLVFGYLSAKYKIVKSKFKK
jgi:hypothetical protein